MFLSEIKKFIWILMHHPDYRLCYVRTPFLFMLRPDILHGGIKLDLMIGFVFPSIYYPWHVSADYRNAIKVESGEEDLYDDIPF